MFIPFFSLTDLKDLRTYFNRRYCTKELFRKYFSSTILILENSVGSWSINHYQAKNVWVQDSNLGLLLDSETFYLLSQTRTICIIKDIIHFYFVGILIPFFILTNLKDEIIYFNRRYCKKENVGKYFFQPYKLQKILCKTE